jgi:hypothetical protein
VSYVETSGTSYAVTQGRIPEKWVSQEISQPNVNQKKQGKKQQQSRKKNDILGTVKRRKNKG